MPLDESSISGEETYTNRTDKYAEEPTWRQKSLMLLPLERLSQQSQQTR
jgi:hypothetical protein